MAIAILGMISPRTRRLPVPSMLQQALSESEESLAAGEPTTSLAEIRAQLGALRRNFGA
jgi:hypothetical protein